MKAITATLGSASRNSSSLLAANSLRNRVTPVALPSGRLRLATRPISTGSPPGRKTVGIVEVAAFAAYAAAFETAYRTVTLRLTSSVANAGRRSGWSPAQRYSISTFWPSTYPASARLRRKTAGYAVRESDEAPLRYPITGIAACCARAASGPAAAAPPSSVRNWRRLRSSMGFSRKAAVPAYRRLRMPQKHPQVLGPDLNRSESRWALPTPVLPQNDSAPDAPEGRCTAEFQPPPYHPFTKPCPLYPRKRTLSDTTSMPLCAMCGRLRVGKAFLHVCRLVGAAMCSAYLRG